MSLSHMSSSSCVVVDGNPECTCLPGHTGPLCDTCDSGYFGQPPLNPCSNCNCSGNIDPQDDNACNKTTGECITCLNNSTGTDCGTCAQGFFGNAKQQNCQSELSIKVAVIMTCCITVLQCVSAIKMDLRIWCVIQ